jgi:hypothetical protein
MRLCCLATALLLTTPYWAVKNNAGKYQCNAVWLTVQRFKEMRFSAHFLLVGFVALMLMLSD